MKQKKQYVAPGLVAVEFRTERGYATSGSISDYAGDINMLLAEQYVDEGQTMEDSRDALGTYWGGYSGSDAETTWF